MQLFLDANAHLPMCQSAIDAFVKYNLSRAGHGHAMAISAPGRDAAAATEMARAQIAGLLGTTPSCIFFTSTCTQACEWASEILSNLKPDKVYISPMEHPAVKFSVRNNCLNVQELISNEGLVNKYLEFNKNDALVCVHVQNEIGTIQPIENWNPKYFLCDLSQTIGKIPLNLSRMPNINMAVMSAHKFGGPAGVGILYLRNSNIWKGYGYGSRYYNDRAGTPDVASIVATGAALKHAIDTLPSRYATMVEFRDVLEPGLADMGWKIMCRDSKRSPGTTFVKVPKSMAHHLLYQLSADGIYVGLGSACGSMHKGPSPLMKSLGYGGGAGDYMRISHFGEYGAQEAKYLLAKIKRYSPSVENSYD